MNRVLLTVAFALMSSCLWAQNIPRFTEETFHKVISIFLKSPDTFFEKECTADFVSIGANGKRVSLNDHKKMFREFVCEKRSYEDLLIRQYGSTGVMTGIIFSVYRRKDGTSFTQKDFCTQLFVWQQGAWKMAGYQATTLDGRRE
nr:hypothetical protein [uncultured Arsenicibacter sp.]